MRTIAHHLARLLGRHAARVLEPVRPKQSMAMYAELEHLDGYAALGWAIGCLAASYRLRASLIAVGVVAARLCVAAAAGLFGAMHVMLSSANLWKKILAIAGEAPDAARATLVRSVDSLPLEHWVWQFVMLSALGLLHVMAAIMMAIGRDDRVLKLAMVVVAFDLMMPLTVGWGGLIVPAIYMGLITLMGVVSAGLAWLWRWDEQRMAPA